MYTGSTEGLSRLLLIAHMITNLYLGHGRRHGNYRVDRVLYDPIYRTNAGADVIALLHYDHMEATWVYVWQVRTRLLHTPGPLTTAARALLKLGFDPLQSHDEPAFREHVSQFVPPLLKLVEVERCEE